MKRRLEDPLLVTYTWEDVLHIYNLNTLTASRGTPMQIPKRPKAGLIVLCKKHKCGQHEAQLHSNKVLPQSDKLWFTHCTTLCLKLAVNAVAYVTMYVEIGHLLIRVSNCFHKYNTFYTFRPNLKRIARIVVEIWLFL